MLLCNKNLLVCVRASVRKEWVSISRRHLFDRERWRLLCFISFMN
ncbi:hypothetical protein RHECNPAF_3340013 [Rhizobium etli CNPAF512]|nr:hypothetical protein RHECNPAF_3340013 [Rhizobium etli CNPAF512]